MPILTVNANGFLRKEPFSSGFSVREILDAAGLRVRSGCMGNGACGLCLVQIEAGEANSPTKNELLHLSPEQLHDNIRLACQVRPENDLSVRIVNAVFKPDWRDLDPEPPPLLSRPPTDKQRDKTAYGLAVDLGTTHISISLLDLNRGNRLFGRIGLNPQSYYGSDVMTRLIAAAESSNNARMLARMPLDAVHDALLDMSSRDDFNPREIIRVTIVGNTSMLVLLTETDPRILLQPSSWTRPIECRLDNAQTWKSVLGIHPEATVEVISPYAGFVGSDLLTGVLAAGLTNHPGGLLIDFGTNSEMALWDGDALRVTSAAGGPAFEGCGITCGMPAEPGAVYRVNGRHNGAPFDFQVIGDKKAKGICGSGLVDLIASLRGSGDLTITGKLAEPHSREGFALQNGSPAIRLNNKDVDMFQRAKAAIGTGIKKLLAMARMNAGELRRVYVCGVFGRHLNTRNAQLIGLLPDIPSEGVKLCGNTALAGCELLLLSPDRRAELASLREQATIINLSQVSDFEKLFLENLYLRPLATDES